MLVVLKPFARIFLSIREGVGALPVALALEKLSLIDVAILIDGLALAVGFAVQHLSCIATTIRERDGLRGRILRLDGHGASHHGKEDI